MSYEKLTSILLEITGIIASSRGRKLADVLHFIISKATEAVDAEGGSIIVIRKKGKMEFWVAVGEKAHRLKEVVLEEGEGIAGKVALDGMPRLVNDPYSHPLFSDRVDRLTGMKTRNLIAVPLKVENRIIGVLEIVNKRQGNFTESDLEVLSSIASQAAKVLEVSLLQQRLKRVKFYYRLIINSNLNGVVVMGRSGRITLINPALKKLFGIKSHIVGTKISKVSNPVLKELGFVMAEVLHSGRPRRRELVYENKYLVARVAPLKINDRIIGVMASVEDVSKLKELEKMYSRAEKLSYLGEMASRLSHEIRNPLAAIKGFLELASNRLPENMKELTESTMLEVERLTKLTDDMVSLRKALNLKRVHADLNDIIKDLQPLLKEQVEREGIAFEVRFSEEFLPVEVDVDKMKQVITNLVKNSLEAIKELKASGVQRNFFIKIEASKSIEALPGDSPKPFAVLKISDNGPGIPEDVRDKIFSPFFTTKRSGSGLGLPISHEIIRGHGGWMTLETEEGRGTTFIIRLPMRI